MSKNGNVCRKFKMSLLKSMVTISFCVMMVYPLTASNNNNNTAKEAVSEIKSGTFAFVGKSKPQAEEEMATLYEVSVNGTVVGYTDDRTAGENAYLNARMEVGSRADSIVYVDAALDIEEYDGKNEISSAEVLQSKIYKILNDSIVEPKKSAYALRVGDVTIYLSGKDEVLELFECIKDKYDLENAFDVVITEAADSMFNSLTANILMPETVDNDVVRVFAAPTMFFADEAEEAAPVIEDGLKTISFEESIEIVESFVSEDQLLSVADAVEFLTKENEEKQTYTVEKGDSMWKIARDHSMSLSQLFAINDNITEKTILQIGQKVVITVPEPELSVLTEEVVTYEESYSAPVQYIYNDSWYTTKSVVRQKGAEGYHVVTANISSRNGKEYNRDVLEETIINESTPEIIEVGTITPPTYIKPVVGGRITSNYGQRWGRLHAGIDYGVATGTSVMASCGGKVISAGWNGGYGNCILIQHSDGSRTRYAHLSKILVTVGQKVKQGEKIALSGNTGNSTGPHLHFEIIVNGSAKNPLNYLK